MARIGKRGNCERQPLSGQDHGPTPEAIVPELVDAEPILAAIQEAESRSLEAVSAGTAMGDKHTLEVAVQRALSVLTRVLLIGHRHTHLKIAALLEQRHLAQDAHHCPHGRPTALVLTRAELDRQFLRT